MSNVKLVSTPILNYYDSKLKKFLNSTYALKSDVGSGGGILYAECSTARNIVDKAVACEGFALVKGACIAIRFTDTSTADPTTGNITLNINNTGAKTIVPKENNTAVAYSWAWAFCKNQTQVFMYNGTNFIWLNQDNNTTYTPMALGFGYGTCTTEEDVTAKVVTLTSYVLIKGGMVSVKFANAVPASATLNINGKGAKYIYYHGAKILAGIINANDIATFVYDGTEYQLIAIDNKASFGKYNKSNDDTLFSVGDGTADDARHNAFEITTNGGKLHDKDIATTDLIPSTLPASGGNADTVNSLRIGSLYMDIFSTSLTNTHPCWNKICCVFGQSMDSSAENFVDNAPESGYDAIWYEVSTIGTGNRAYQIAHGCYSNQRKSFIRYMHDWEWSSWKNIADGGNADTVDGLHAEKFMRYEPGRNLTTSINDMITPGTYGVYSITPDFPAVYGSWGLLEVQVYGLICYQIIKFDNGIIINRAKIVNQTEWSEWKKLCDGGNADTVGGLYANDFTQIIDFGDSETDTKTAIGQPGKTTIYRCTKWTDYPAEFIDSQGTLIAINYNGSGTTGTDWIWCTQIIVNPRSGNKMFIRYIEATSVSDWKEISTTPIKSTGWITSPTDQYGAIILPNSSTREYLSITAAGCYSEMFLDNDEYTVHITNGNYEKVINTPVTYIAFYIE